MAHRLNMQTVAEYVENQHILSVITDMGLDYAQGYGIGKPEPLNHILGKK
jgi:EAL domain-containing protein (putative c-di-GMP-specific phosphodiesterase class I)